MSRYATPEDALEAAEGWSNQVLECRTYGHRWEPLTASWSKDKKTIDTTQTCLCEAERHATLDGRSGWVLSMHVSYPKGYLMAPGTGRVTGDAKGALRLEAVTRIYGLRRRTARKAS